MIKQLRALALIFALTLLPVASTQAHLLSTETTVGAILHINPDDSPSITEPTNFELWFSDTSDQLDLFECNCIINIEKDDKLVATQTVNPVDVRNSSNTFQFPEAGTYTLKVTGTPKQPNSFNEFVLEYNVRVNSGNLEVQSFPILLWYGIAGVIGLLVLAAYFMETSYNKGK